LKRGDGTIEFYANLKWLKEQYEAGFVVAKRLYEKAVNERGFKMKYWQFNKYFNEELNHRKHKKDEQKIKQNTPAQNTQNIEENKPKRDGPIIARMDKPKRVFDPLFNKEYDPSRVIK
jgi:hypothetical protein